MGRRRLDLHNILTEIDEVGPVYFQPSVNVTMSFPCIVYERDYEDVKFAGDMPYNRTKRYKVTVIDRNPDSEIPDRVAALPMCSFDRYFVADNLHHYSYKIYF